MSNLRQKHKQAGIPTADQCQLQQLEVLHAINEKLETMMGLLTNIQEQNNTVVIQKEFHASSDDVVNSGPVERDSSFIPSIDLDGMTANHKGVSVKNRSKNVKDNLKKLKDLNGDNNG